MCLRNRLELYWTLVGQPRSDSLHNYPSICNSGINLSRKTSWTYQLSFYLSLYLSLSISLYLSLSNFSQLFLRMHQRKSFILIFSQPVVEIIFNITKILFGLFGAPGEVMWSKNNYIWSIWYKNNVKGCVEFISEEMFEKYSKMKMLVLKFGTPSTKYLFLL